MPRRLRIGHQLSARLDGDPIAAAVRAEELGFDIVLAADHVGPGWAPSGGRFELGLGAGHTPSEYAATGIERSAPAERKQRLAESVEIIRDLLDHLPAMSEVSLSGRLAHR
jgi:alkanesulfonate monooxygenase SsuD/methylene tetrahydromethanopterin reductase-like flavin-dependent oxidoreductase (luciferase family)